MQLRLSSVRRKRALIAVSAAALGIAMIPALAQANLVGSTFESTDGDLVHVGTNLDWDNAPNRVRQDDAPSGGSDNSFGQGTKEDDNTPTVVDGSIPPNKSDLTRFYIANNKGSNDHQFMYLAWERTNTLGSANMDFEINKLAQPDLTVLGTKTLNRSLGDLLIRFDFGGSGAPVLSLVKWLTVGSGAVNNDCTSSGATVPCWGALPADDALDGITTDQQIDLSQAGFADGSVYDPTITDKKNPPTEPDPIAGVSLLPLTFGEAAIDLTAAGVFPSGNSTTCTSFGSAYLKSRASDSFTAETKDFVPPATISINNCGGLVIRKVVVGGSGTFGYTSTTLADQTAGDPDTTFTLAATPATPGTTGSIYSGILAGTYDATETVPTGWELTSATCDHAFTKTGPALTGIAVVVGETTTCTFTNTAQATLRIDKVTSPAADATLFDFDPSAGAGGTDLGADFQLADATAQKVYANILPATYSVLEKNIPTGWVLTGRGCVNTVGGASHASDTSVSGTISVALAAGEDVTCTFTNRKNAKVTITKHDDSDPANNVDGAVFTVYEDLAPASLAAPGAEDLAGPAVFTCTTVAGTCSSGFILTPGTSYWVVETTTPDGYFTAAPQRITPTAGQNVQLTFVNPRKFKVITIVCRLADNSLYGSTVDLNGTNGVATATSPPAGVTAAQLCSISGAAFSPLQYGNYNGTVHIPQ